MSPTTTRAALLVILVAACECDDGPTSPEPSTEQRSEGATAETEAPETPPAHPAPEPEPAPDIEVDGLTARRVEGGLIEVRGTDRWGGRVDTTYESAEYLKNALPVLERSITEEQAAALRAYVETLEDQE